tara:strand:- start:764 stop:1096 length:333 start_codon:yes stop_codon:yes gene_type:complete
MSRYSNRIVATNDDDMYKETLEERGVKRIVQYTTPTLKRPTDAQLNKIRYKKYYWTIGDRFWRIAEREYGDKSLWWIIARFNNKPTEGHMEPGGELKIPTDIILAREYLS